MHPIDEFGDPLFIMLTVAAVLFLIGDFIWQRIKKHRVEGEAFFEDFEPLGWTCEQELAWRNYFAGQIESPATEARW